VPNHEEARETFILALLSAWEGSETPVNQKIWTIVTMAMEYVGEFKDWEGVDKKEEALLILETFLDKTDSPGPDSVVDKAILWLVDAGIDYLYDAFKGRFTFDGKEV